LSENTDAQPFNLSLITIFPYLEQMSTPVQPTSSTLDPPNSAAKLDHLSQEKQDALRAAVFQRLHPRAYLERYIAEDVRPDGRTFLEFRDVYVNVGMGPSVF
jgi:polyribonucleotide nucleotidyltransferase